MVKIILYGCINDDEIAKILINLLEGEYNITYQTPTEINSFSINARGKEIEEILILETDSIEVIESSDTVVIFKNMVDLRNNIVSVGDNVTFVVNSEDEHVVDFLKRLNIKKAISCGLHLSDTVSISSCCDTEKVICLLRKVRTVEGQVIEPFELPIDTNVSLSTVLIVFSIMILLNRVDIIKRKKCFT